jgi:uncharacterized membrane protein YdfJ with MMPL/SSD domain
MFGRIGHAAVRRPWLITSAWIIAAVALAVFSPQLKPTSDQADFLPSHHESVQTQKIQENAFPQNEQPAAVAVFQRSDGEKLTTADRDTVTKISADPQRLGIDKIKRVETSPEAVSPNGEIALAGVIATTKDAYDPGLTDSVKKLREEARPMLRSTDLTVGFTGSAASALDSEEASGDTDSMGSDPREATARAVARSVPAIGAASVILAGTFGVLMLAKNSMLQQMGFAVAFGILLSASLMAMLLVPALTTLFGHRAWWPGHKPQPTPAESVGVPVGDEAGRPLVRGV